MADLYHTQAQQKLSTENFTLGKSDQYGQRITIEITIGNAQNIATIKSGWMIETDGSLRLITPFAGFVD